jgi:uncharacterized protein DUF6966
MGNDASELEATLEEIVELLLAHGEKHWRAWLARDLDLIRAGDLYGVEHLLSAYGGMGSFTDLFLCPENGHAIARSEVDSANDTLRHLSSKAWELARGVQRAV